LRTLAQCVSVEFIAGVFSGRIFIKIGAKVVSHGRYVILQMAEVAIARQMFQGIR
jgi:hypothetical protein